MKSLFYLATTLSLAALVMATPVGKNAYSKYSQTTFYKNIYCYSSLALPKKFSSDVDRGVCKVRDKWNNLFNN